MGEYKGEIELEIEGTTLTARGTWGVFEKVSNNTKKGPYDIYLDCMSNKWTPQEIGYLLYFGIKAVPKEEQAGTSLESLEAMDYPKFVAWLESAEKAYLATKCAEMCELFLFGVNKLDEIKPLEPEDGVEKK